MSKFKPTTRGARRPSHPVAWTILIIALLLGAFLAAAEFTVRPVLSSAARAVAYRAAVDSLNQAVTAELVENADFNRIVHVDRTEHGALRVAHFDFAAVTKLQAAATEHADQALDKLEGETYHVPLTQVVGSSVFSAVGPSLPVHMRLYGSAHSSTVVETKTVGINQTVHVLYLDLNASIYVFAPFLTEPVAVKTRVPIAYVIVAGEVPGTVVNGGGYSPTTPPTSTAPNVRTY